MLSCFAVSIEAFTSNRLLHVGLRCLAVDGSMQSVDTEDCMLVETEGFAIFINLGL